VDREAVRPMWTPRGPRSSKWTRPREPDQDAAVEKSLQYLGSSPSHLQIRVSFSFTPQPLIMNASRVSSRPFAIACFKMSRRIFVGGERDNNVINNIVTIRNCVLPPATSRYLGQNITSRPIGQSHWNNLNSGQDIPISDCPPERGLADAHALIQI
jgi:hypothetical protein